MAKKVLVVEYEKNTINELQTILKSPHFEVEVVPDGEVAKQKLEEIKFDMLITAAMIPKSVSFTHGFALSKYASERYFGLKIIIISGIYKGYEYKRQAVSQYKANNFFEKPLNLEEVQTYICNLLGVNLNEEKAEVKEDVEKKQDKDELSSVDLFGDIIDRVEKKDDEKSNVQHDNAQIMKNSKFSHPRINKSELESRENKNINIPTIENRKTDPEISKKLEKTLSGLGLNSLNTKKSTKKIDKTIDKKFEETLSGLGIKKSKLKTVNKDEVSKPTSPSVKQSVEQNVSKKPGKDKESMFDNYEVLGLINRGGMAEIYRARKRGVKGFEKIVAIKKIISGYVEDDNYIEMFVDEAKIAAELTHPNIVQIHDFGKKDDYYFIAMEYVQGKDLRVILKRIKELNIPMPEYIGLYIVQKLLEALSYAHTAKNSLGESLDIVHRDISPPNVIVSYHGDIKLTDFGISKASNKLHQTISGALKGKLLYMSPEQARGEKDIDKRADIYSVGIMLYELITGKKAFLDNSEMAILSKVQKGNFAPPSSVLPNIDKELESIIMKSLDKDKTKRYQSGGGMLRALNSYIMERFSLVPDSQHMAAFIYQLFSEEIEKKNLKISKLTPPDIKIRERVVGKEEEEEKQGGNLKSDYNEAPIVKKETKKDKFKSKEDTYIGPVEFNLDDDKFKDDKKKENIVEEKDNADNLDDILKEDKGAIKDNLISNENDFRSAISDVPKDKPTTSIPSTSTNNFSSNSTSTKSSQYNNDNWGSNFMGDEKEPNNSNKKIIFIAVGAVLVLLALYFVFTGSGEDKEKTSVKKKNVVETKKQEEKKESVKEQEAKSEADKLKEKEEEQKRIEKEKEEEQKRIEKENEKERKRANAAKKEKERKKREAEARKKKKEKEEKKAVKVPTKTIEAKPKEEKKKEVKKEEVKKEEAPKPVVPKAKEGDFVRLPDVKPIGIDTPLPMNKKIRKLMKKMSNNEIVVVSLLIGHKGSVKKIVFVKKSSNIDINIEISSLLSSWKYKPAEKDGVKVSTKITKTFTLKK